MYSPVTLPDDLLYDLRYAVRSLRKAPLFTLAAALSLGIGIGANAGVFTVAERTLLRPLPVSHAHRLVYVTDDRVLTHPSPRFSFPFYLAIRETPVLDGVAARAEVALTATVSGDVIRLTGELVSGNYFSVLGARVQHGRALAADDERRPGGHPVVVISDPLWRRMFAGEPSALGQEVTLNGHTFTIVGVAGKGFVGTDIGSPADIWISMAMQREIGRDLMAEARTNWLEMIGRARSDVSWERAGEELTKTVERSGMWRTDAVSRRMLLVSGARGTSPARAEVGPAFAILMALALLALAVASINVASLVGVRTMGRQTEVAIRVTLGARRSRLVRQFLAEGLMLSTLGAVIGVLLAPSAARLLVASQPRPLGIELSLDGRVLLFGLVVSAAAALVIALVPILASKTLTSRHAFEQAGARPAAGTRQVNAHDLVVTLQIAMSLTMLISAGLFAQSLRRLDSTDPGFRTDNVLLASLDPKAGGYDSNRIEAFWHDVLDRVGAISGVASVSLARTVPLATGRQRQPWENPAAGREEEVDTNFVSGHYFRTLGIPLAAGREFDERDSKMSRPVVIVTERLARSFWPEQDPIGKGIRIPESGMPIAEVVGVVRDVNYRDLRTASGAMIYRPLFQTRSTDAMTLHVRASPDVTTIVTSIRRTVQQIDSNVPLDEITTLQELLAGSFAQTRQAAVLTGVFGLMALALSGIGVYAIAATTVRRRTRDIGIRMALGARGRDLIRTVGSRGAAIIALGLALGIAGALGFTRLTAMLLFGVTAADAGMFVGTTALMASVATIAMAIPLRAATRLDAVTAIRSE